MSAISDGADSAGDPPDGRSEPAPENAGLLRALRRHRNFRLAMTGQGISGVGSWMQVTAQEWLVLDLTHGSGAAVGITVGLQVLPMALFGLYGSVLADRYPKRRILLASQAAMGMLALVLGLLTVTGSVRLWNIYALAFGYGLAVVLNNPAWVAFTRELVGRDDLSNAVGLNSATLNMTRIVGPAVGGVLIAAVGTGPVFLINAASFGVMEIVLYLMRENELFARKPVPRAKGQLRESLRYVRGDRELAMVMTVMALVAAFGMNFAVTNALMSREVFHTGASSFGLVTTMMAVGGLAGALLSARRRRPSTRGMLTAATAFSVLVIASGLMPAYPAFAAMQLATGLAMTMFATTASSLVQLSAPEAMSGRVMGLYLLVVSVGSPIGYPLIGWLAENFGARSTLIVGGLGSLVSVAAAVALMAPVTAGLRSRGTALRP
ncbi:MFS transporter [Actinomadura verrucosospora]|uniref:Drug resistance efflux protein n=1 Tax=Actinomadura verrucosospora TaxID=46165 RepID=A0A7D3VQN2_ACTVE|nr:MFS transporter [Actinomadura verrucosospora]QKG20538.1 drug resistance efflux protein [Actinomadura verrucosospora]